jgi:lipopolysaccharide export system permease protein
MIRIISRYILRQYLVPLTYILSAFCLMYVIADLFERFPDFVQAKVPLLRVLQYYGYYLFAVNGFVPFIVVILPIVLLLGALYTLTMFARHNELTAMLASGVSIRRMMTPFLFVGFCASVFCAVTQETVGPFATRWIAEFNRSMSPRKNESADLVKDYFYHTGLTHRQWQIGEFNPRKPTRLMRVKVNQERQDGSLAIEYLATRAEYLDGRWWFYGLQQRTFNELGDPLGPITPPVEMPQEMVEFGEAPADFVSELQKPDYLSSFEMMRYLDSRPDMKGPSRTRREVDIFSRLAMPWSCMVMILLSLPATAGGVRRPALRSVAFGLGALFLFYILLQGGIILGKVGIIEPWLAGWLPNIAFLMVGAFLTWRLR